MDSRYNRPVHSEPTCSPHDHRVIEQLWERINSKFATNRQVIDLAAELRKLEMGMNVQTQHVANAAAAMVLKSLQEDLAHHKGFSVEIVPFTDKDGRPVVSSDIDFNKIYITPSQNPDESEAALWDEWIAVPMKHAIGCRHHNRAYKWERIGNKKIDLEWVSKDINKVNECIAALKVKLDNSTKGLAKAILEKAVKPLKELRQYVHSPEYVQFVFEKLPRAALGTDGLMTGNQFAILSMLSVWASTDHKQYGGGALGADVVIHLLNKAGIPVDDLKEEYQHKCGMCD